MDSIILLGGITALLILSCKSKKTTGTGAMSDMPVTLANVRMGIQRGWYSAELTTVNGQKAVRLSGKQTDGSYTSDVYPVDEATWQALKQDGVKEV